MSDDDRRRLQAIPRTSVMIASNKMSVSSQVIPGCSEMKEWNAYICDDDRIGTLIIDSLDADRMDRSVQPVYV